jgi:tRNA (guanine-N7-)-methyltransferase
MPGTDTGLSLAYPCEPVRWDEVFGDLAPVELEVGCGKGLFLANAARSQPSVNYLGVEISRKYASRAVERLEKLGLLNVRVCTGDARRLLAHYVPAGSLAGLHVYFPDPWWKKRHRKRRVFDESFVADAARALRPGGKLWVATDVSEYYDVIVRLVATRIEFRDLGEPEVLDPRHDLDYLTNFERKYRIAGRAIYRRVYVRDERS